MISVDRQSDMRSEEWDVRWTIAHAHVAGKTSHACFCFPAMIHEIDTVPIPSQHRRMLYQTKPGASVQCSEHDVTDTMKEEQDEMKRDLGALTRGKAKRVKENEDDMLEDD